MGTVTIQFKEVNCKNCYKCIRSCPVKAISLIDDHAQVIEDGCVLCGKCLQVCPQNAKSVRTEVDKVKGFINRKQKVYASVAPSLPAAFGTKDLDKIRSVFRQLGFTHVEETAYGAAAVSEEYVHLMEQGNMTNIISTACPTVVSLVERHYPQLIGQLAPVVSPMVAHGRMLRELYGTRIKVVFIGPCLSKKEEYLDAQNGKAVDAVITFDELEEWMQEAGVSFDTEPTAEVETNLTARFYPAPGGIIKSIGSFKRFSYKPLKFDGTDRCIQMLEELSKGQVSGYFIEMNSCAGACLEGPCMNAGKPDFIKIRENLIEYASKHSRHQESSAQQAKAPLSRHFLDRSGSKEMPQESEISKVLAMIGKFRKSDELNCGACGYGSCREKAIAVIQGKAEVRMCVPFMRQRAESLSNVIIESTPNAIFALSECYDIQEANQAACRMFRITQEECRNRKIYELMECPDIYQVAETGEDILNTKYYYENYDLSVEQSILYLKENRMLIMVMKDISKDERRQAKLNEAKAQTVELAQTVIEKQMRVAQEIASLLGETTAETKVALTRLKKVIQSEIGDEK